MVYTYVTNGIPIDFNYIRKELIRLDKFKEYQSWLDKTYLGIYQNRAYLLLFITFMIRRTFAVWWEGEGGDDGDVEGATVGGLNVILV